ncbi:MAG: hypothetical protein ACX933_18275, partial [Marinobacter adhaerens]
AMSDNIRKKTGAAGAAANDSIYYFEETLNVKYPERNLSGLVPFRGQRRKFDHGLLADTMTLFMVVNDFRDAGDYTLTLSEDGSSVKLAKPSLPKALMDSRDVEQLHNAMDVDAEVFHDEYLSDPQSRNEHENMVKIVIKRNKNRQKIAFISSFDGFVCSPGPFTDGSSGMKISGRPQAIKPNFQTITGYIEAHDPDDPPTETIVYVMYWRLVVHDMDEIPDLENAPSADGDEKLREMMARNRISSAKKKKLLNKMAGAKAFRAKPTRVPKRSQPIAFASDDDEVSDDDGTMSFGSASENVVGVDPRNG